MVFSARWGDGDRFGGVLDDTGYAFDAKVFLPYGSDVICPAVAPHTYSWCYELSGWDVYEDELECVTEDMTLNAVYTYLETEPSLFRF